MVELGETVSFYFSSSRHTAFNRATMLAAIYKVINLYFSACFNTVDLLLLLPLPLQQGWVGTNEFTLSGKHSGCICFT